MRNQSKVPTHGKNSFDNSAEYMNAQEPHNKSCNVTKARNSFNHGVSLEFDEQYKEEIKEEDELHSTINYSEPSDDEEKGNIKPIKK